jgi:hypothetical protein
MMRSEALGRNAYTTGRNRRVLNLGQRQIKIAQVFVPGCPRPNFPLRQKEFIFHR